MVAALLGSSLKRIPDTFFTSVLVFFYESKLLTSINGGSPPGPPAQDAGDRVALLSTHSFRPPPCVLWPYTPIIYPWLYTYCKLHIAPPPPPAKYGEQYRGHCGNLVRALCWKDRFTNIGHPGQSRLDALHDARLALCEAHNALCTPYNMHCVLNIA